MNRIWWNEENNLSLVVVGQVIYFATPIGNYLKSKYDRISIYHSTWSIDTTIMEAANMMGLFVTRAYAELIRLMLQAQIIS